MSNKTTLLPSSFRDPSGQLFTQENHLYRQINKTYKDHYDNLINSGLYNELTNDHLLIPHEEVDIEPPFPEKTYKIIKPDPIPFISYPYEWCFSQLKDAALATLKIQKRAIEHEMILKDASAYNIQFYKNKPILIDTLSLETYQEGEPWVAYKQFCQHFLGPLALMHYRDVRFLQLLKVHIDGIPLDLVSKLLPFSSNFRFSILSHIHLHAKSQQRFAKNTTNTETKTGEKKVSRFSLLGIIDNLESAVNKLRWEPGKTTWSCYYQEETGQDYINDKKKHVDEFLDKTADGTVWDIGANTGIFSKIASTKGRDVLSIDLDPACVEISYRESNAKATKILPLLIDFANPSPSIGWENKERMSFIERGPAETVLALALLHHLAISNNVPFQRLAEFFHTICRYLIIEFIPKDDVQVKRLLASREDIFIEYSEEYFEKYFEKYFEIKDRVTISSSNRVLYLMEDKTT